MIDLRLVRMRHPRYAHQTTSALHHLCYVWTMGFFFLPVLIFLVTLELENEESPRVEYDDALNVYAPVRPAHFNAGRPFVVIREDELIPKP